MENAVFQSPELKTKTVDDVINGRYRVIKELGRGGMGIVFLVEDTARDNENIVLKVFHAKHSDPEIIESLRREFAILSALRHPNLVRVIDFGKFSDRDEYFYTMEYVNGKDFFDAVGSFSSEILVKLFIQLVQALGYIHASGILHGDIKSENIMVYHDEKGNPNIKVMDFGLAVRKDENIKLKQTLSGTLEYMAPELFQKAPVTFSTDLYAVGILMYWALTGKAPFYGSPDDIKSGHLRTLPKRFSALGVDLSDKLESVIFRLLSKDPLERFASCEELLTALGVEDYDSAKTRDLISPLIMDAFLKLRDPEIQKLLLQISIGLSQHDDVINFITINGNEGSGAYRILQDVKSKMQLDNISVLESWCRDDKGSLYQPFIDAFKGYADIEKLVSETEAELLAIRQNRDDYELGRFRFMEEFSNLVRDLSRRKRIVIILRNLEQANNAVLDLIYYLGRSLVHDKVSIVVTITTDRQSDEAALNIQKGRDSLAAVYDFRVKCLEETELEQLLLTAFKPSLFPARFYQQLYGKSGGNVEIVAAIVTALNNAGFFIRSDRTWMMSETYDLESLDLSSINALYLNTFRNLSELQKNILQNIAVYDSAIEKRLLLHLVNCDENEIQHNVEILMDKRILLEHHDKLGTVYSFLSIAFRDAVMGQLSETAKSDITARIAAYLLECSDMEYAPNQKALHFLRAGYIVEGIPLASQAINILKNSNSYRRALVIAQLALDHSPADKKRLVRFFKRNVADLKDSLGDSTTALDLYSELLPDYKAGVAKSALERRISDLYQKIGNVDQADEALNRALKQAPASAIIERALILRELAWLSIMRGNYQEAIQLGEKALNLLPENSPSRIMALTLNTLGGASFYSGNIEYAIKYFAKSASVKKEMGDKKSMAATLNNLGIVYNVSGDPEKASTYWRSSMEVMEEAGDWAGLAENYNNLGILLMESGQYERALNYFKKCKDLKNRIGDIRGLVASHCNIGELLFLREDYTNALNILDEGIKFSERIRSESTKAEMLFQKSRVYVALYQIEQAQMSIDACLKITESLNDKSKLGEYLVMKSRIKFLETGEFENPSLHEAKALSDKDSNIMLKMQIEMFYLQYYIEQGQMANALKILPSLQKVIEDSNFKWYKLQIMILFANAMYKAQKPIEVIEKTLDRAEEIAQSMGLMLQVKSIYYLRGKMYFKAGDKIKSYKCFRKAYQCLKLCLTHIEPDSYKQSLIKYPENLDLLKSIKTVKASM